jgi:hypothetical protein
MQPFLQNTVKFPTLPPTLPNFEEVGEEVVRIEKII